MIEEHEFTDVVEKFFSFLVEEFDFELAEEKIRGNAFFEVQYKNRLFCISISYENIERYYLVIIFVLQNGHLPDYDDKTKTLHLSRLNETLFKIVDKAEIDSNNKYFSMYDVKSEFETQVLKSAKQLRLCLIHLDKLLQQKTN